jgi:Radical SAM superfamily
MLCHGVAANAEVRTRVARLFALGLGFIHGTVFLLDGHIPVNTSFLDGVDTDDAPLLRLDDDDRPYIESGGHRFACPPITPSAVNHRPLGWGTVGDYFTLHNPTTVFAAPLRQCVFISSGRPCLFCTFEGGRLQRLSAEDFAAGLRAIMRDQSVQAVAIGGGTPNLVDHGASYYASLVTEAKRLNLQVSVELVPPPQVRDLDLLLDAGADALIMSLEIWDEGQRARVCLGKGQLPRSHYIEAWRYATERLGRGMVSSVLLFGLEAAASTEAGALELVDMDVVPTILPYRRYAASHVAPVFPPDAQAYARVARVCADALSRRGLSAMDQPGCTGCQGCSLEGLLQQAPASEHENA